MDAMIIAIEDSAMHYVFVDVVPCTTPLVVMMSVAVMMVTAVHDPQHEHVGVVEVEGVVVGVAVVDLYAVAVVHRNAQTAENNPTPYVVAVALSYNTKRRTTATIKSKKTLSAVPNAPESKHRRLEKVIIGNVKKIFNAKKKKRMR